MNSSLYAFTLGREWKLSLAELFAVWGEEAYREHTETIAIFQILGYSDEQIQKRFLTIGGSIRVMKVIGESDPKRFPTDVIQEIQDAHSRHSEERRIQELRKKSLDTSQVQYDENGKWWKITFALGAYGLDFQLSNIGLRIKKTLQERGYSARLVNTENENIVSAVFKRERLWKTGLELNLIAMTPLSKGEWSQEPRTKNQEPRTYLTITLACQDIDAYTRRDTGKSRDMVVGMMPPKLVQMMINITTTSSQPSPKREGGFGSPSLKEKGSGDEGIYDPFCGLGTTLIEAANMGITRIYGSDLSPEMVAASKQSLAEFIREERVWQERIKAAWGTPSKDFSDFESDIFLLDARKIRTGLERILRSSNLRTFEPSNIQIISEWYLGEMMSPRDITLDKVQSERKKLASLYMDFFSWLRDAKFCGSLVMSFPFWNMHGTYSYFTEIYDVIEKCGFQVIDLLPGAMWLNTRHGSLLYRRENQTVGREIVKMVRR